MDPLLLSMDRSRPALRCSADWRARGWPPWASDSCCGTPQPGSTQTDGPCALLPSVGACHLCGLCGRCRISRDVLPVSWVCACSAFCVAQAVGSRGLRSFRRLNPFTIGVNGGVRLYVLRMLPVWIRVLFCVRLVRMQTSACGFLLGAYNECHALLGFDSLHLCGHVRW